MKLVVGLGNPGTQYRETRHNVGFMVADELARRHGVSFEASPAEALTARVRSVPGGVLIAKPLTFMNLSGRAVADLVRFFKIDAPDLLLVADDVALPLGRLRARAEGSHGGHNGFRSVFETMGRTDIPRLRIGVGRGDPRRDLAAHVLARFEPDERDAVEAAVTRAAEAADGFVTSGIEWVMNRFNGDVGPEID